MLDTYNKVLQAFPQSEHLHYQFTPRDLTAWIEGLRQYSLEDMDFWMAVAHEGGRIFRDRLVGETPRSTFDGILVTVMKSQVGSASISQAAPRLRSENRLLNAVIKGN